MAVQFSQRNRKGNMQGGVQLIFLFSKTEVLLLVQYSVSDEVMVFIHFIQKCCMHFCEIQYKYLTKYTYICTYTQTLLQFDLYHI